MFTETTIVQVDLIMVINHQEEIIPMELEVLMKERIGALSFLEKYKI